MAGTATRDAVDALRDLIFAGVLAPGTTHLEGDLAERLGVSRTPVREALLVLEAQGLVAVKPRRGAEILALSAQEMDDVYEVLTELETCAAARAARLVAEGAVSKEDLRPLAMSIADMEAALAEEDRRSWSRADEAFHAGLVSLAGNARLAAAVALSADQVRRARAQTLRERPLPTASVADHRAVLEALAAGDAETAAKLHRAHRTGARSLLVGLLK